ncbi:MAG: hypothetical protein EAZ89_02505 [Bacteroidetes bacterium]|nr:MAG: hypothetical protein EAZ89_02505 [Bacteroidota bacterium]
MSYDLRELHSIADTLLAKAPLLAKTQISLGFDAFIDQVLKIVRQKEAEGQTHFFESGLEWGQYIVEKGEKNFSLELVELASKIGGNMPITANALAQMGAQVSCVGPLGHPQIHPAFQELPANCRLYSFGNPGLSHVMEFTSGKIMLANMGKLHSITWEQVCDSIGMETLRTLFAGADAVALLNWGELDNSTSLWQGLLKDILPGTGSSPQTLGFFDLADCSSRSAEKIREALDLIRAFSAYWQVVLSLNVNEASILCRILAGKKVSSMSHEEMAKVIFGYLGIDTVIIHHARQSLSLSAEGMALRNSFFVEQPRISTGAGDNFNAGFCTGRLLGLGNGPALTLGNAISSLYMQSMQSPDIQSIAHFLLSTSDTSDL